MPPRLGELLLDAGLLTNEQLAQGLRAQVMWGGRLGTSLIELGYLELDELSRVLGRQQRYPAALGWHFEQADLALQKRLSPGLAERYACLPLVRSGDKVIVATASPIDARGLRAIAAELGTESAHVMPALAAELRIRYHLERAYALPRETRYLRTRSACRLPFETESERPDLRTPRIFASPDDRPLPIVKPPEPAAEKPRIRRSYVVTLGASQLLGLEPPDRRPRGTTGSMTARRTLPPLGPSLRTAARTIRTSVDREQIADLVVATLAHFVPACQAAIVLVVRGDVAMPMCGFRRDGQLVPDIAVPLEEPGLVPAVIRSRATARDPAGNLGIVDRALFEALGGKGDLIVEPVEVAGHVLGVIAMTAREDDDPTSVMAIAHATGAALTRLIRDAAAP